MWLHHIEHMKTPRFNFIFHLHYCNATKLCSLTLSHSPKKRNITQKRNVNKLCMLKICIQSWNGHILQNALKSWKIDFSRTASNFCPILFANTENDCYIATNLNIWPNIVVFALQLKEIFRIVLLLHLSDVESNTEQKKER